MLNSLTIGNHSLSCFRFDVEYFGSKWAKFKLLHISGSIGLYSVNVLVSYKFSPEQGWSFWILGGHPTLFACGIMQDPNCFCVALNHLGVCSPKAWAIFLSKRWVQQAPRLDEIICFLEHCSYHGGFFTLPLLLTLQAASNSRSRRQGASIIFLHEKTRGLER